MLSRRQFLLTLALANLAGRTAQTQTSHPWIVAHRGGSPENTLAAFSKAISLGCDAIELDIHLTADQHLVVIHDQTLKRTTQQSGNVGEMTLAQIRRVAPSVPSLLETLQLAKNRCRLLVEIKHPGNGHRYEGIEKVLLQQLQQEAMLEQVVVVSFDSQSLHILKSKVKTGLLFGDSIHPAEKKADLGLHFLCPHYRLATPDFIQEAHDLDLRVNAWTVNLESEMRTLIEAGCDAITSDRPDLLKAVLEG